MGDRVSLGVAGKTVTYTVSASDVDSGNNTIPDLIAVGREALYDPFVAVHWARSLGCDPGFALHHKEYGWWLDKRARSLDRIRAA